MMTARIPDVNGWFEVKRNPLSRVGVFAYKGRMIGAPDPDKIYMVYRPAETLADPDCAASFRLVPLINDHIMLGNDPVAGFLPADEKGTHGVIGEQVAFDPTDGTLYGNLKVWSKSLAADLDAGKTNLSLGYRARYAERPGLTPNGQAFDYIQVRMRGNHVALVDDGRCGEDVAVLDSNDVETIDIITFDAKEAKAMPTESLKKRNLRAHSALVKLVTGAFAARVKAPKAVVDRFAMDADDTAAVASEPGLSDVAEMLQDVLPAIADINSALAGASPGASEDDMEAVMDATGKPVMDENGKPKMQKKAAPAVVPPPATDAKLTLDKVAMDAALEAATAPLRAQIAALQAQTGAKAVMGEITKRNALAGQLSAFVGTFDHSDMTLAEVAAYGVKKLDIPTTDGAEIASITAWLHGRQPPRATHTVGYAMDGGNGGKNPLADYLAGK